MEIQVIDNYLSEDKFKPIYDYFMGIESKWHWIDGVRPTVRGVAMNPVDHPHGGGEGKTSGGRNPVTPWGMPTKGYRTRKPKASDKLIVKRRYK